MLFAWEVKKVIEFVKLFNAACKSLDSCDSCGFNIVVSTCGSITFARRRQVGQRNSHLPSSTKPLPDRSKTIPKWILWWEYCDFQIKLSCIMSLVNITSQCHSRGQWQSQTNVQTHISINVAKILLILKHQGSKSYCMVQHDNIWITTNAKGSSWIFWETPAPNHISNSYVFHRETVKPGYPVSEEWRLRREL